MPTIRQYTVIQTRQVKITANSLVDASRIGNSVLHDLPLPVGIYGQAVSAIEEREITIQVDP